MCELLRCLERVSDNELKLKTTASNKITTDCLLSFKSVQSPREQTITRGLHPIHIRMVAYVARYFSRKLISTIMPYSERLIDAYFCITDGSAARVNGHHAMDFVIFLAT
jgi:hypothetical protein